MATKNTKKREKEVEEREAGGAFFPSLPLHFCAFLCFLWPLPYVAVAADVESRVLTHYVPQDLLEAAVRKEGWTEIVLAVKGGVRKGDVVRIWAGGSIDRGGDVPGEKVVGPDGVAGGAAGGGLALSPEPGHAYGLL